MNDMTLHTDRLPVAIARPAPWSDALNEALGWADHFHDDPAKHGRSVPVVVKQEAAALLSEWRQRCQAASSALIIDWLRNLNIRLAAPLDPKDFNLRAAAIADTVVGLPVGAFTRDTLREAGQSIDFFPGAKAVAEILRPHENALRNRLYSLERIASSEPPPLPAPEPLTEEQRQAAVAARDAAITATYARHGVARPHGSPEETKRPRPRPHYATGEVLRQLRLEAGMPMSLVNAATAPSAPSDKPRSYYPTPEELAAAKAQRGAQ